MDNRIKFNIVHTLYRKSNRSEGDILKILLIAGSIIFPLIMFYSQKYWLKLRFIYHVTAIIAALIFGNIASISIYQIIRDNTVFMTAIHGIFLNPYFLTTGAYLGVYILYRLLQISVEELQSNT